MSQKQTLDRLVLFPTPLTPTKVILYGIRCCVDVSGDDNFSRMESNRSVDVFGVKMLVIELDRACRTAVFVATAKSIVVSIRTAYERTLKPPYFFPDEALPDAFANFLSNVLGHVLLHQVLLHALQHRVEIIL